MHTICVACCDICAINYSSNNINKNMLHVHVCIYGFCMCIVVFLFISLVNHKGVTSHMWKATNSTARLQCADQEVNHKCVEIQNLQHCAEQQKAHHPCVQIQTISMKNVELCATSTQASGWNFSP